MLIMLEHKPYFQITFLKIWGNVRLLNAFLFSILAGDAFMVYISEAIIQPSNNFPVIFISNQNVPKEQEIPDAELDVTSGLRVVRS